MHRLKNKVKEHAHLHRHHKKDQDSLSHLHPETADNLDRQLAQLGLKIKDMTGDGNCLFRALSDQFDGTPDNYAKHREIVCDHLSKHPDVYAPFVDLDGEGSFENHVRRMRRDGCYGGNMEVVAFARAQNVDVAVHQAGEPVWVVSGEPIDANGQPQPPRRTLHIVYHSWEHYSSVRNISGPIHGLPNITVVPTDTPSSPNRESVAPPNAMERNIMNTTGVDDISRIRSLLTEFKGNPNRVMELLYTAEDMAANEAAAADVDGTGLEGAVPAPAESNATTDMRYIPATVNAISDRSNAKPKRVSARDRKEAARKARKENAMARKAGKLSGSSRAAMPQGAMDNIIDPMKAIRI